MTNYKTSPAPPSVAHSEIRRFSPRISLRLAPRGGRAGSGPDAAKRVARGGVSGRNAPARGEEGGGGCFLVSSFFLI